MKQARLTGLDQGTAAPHAGRLRERRPHGRRLRWQPSPDGRARLAAWLPWLGAVLAAIAAPYLLPGGFGLSLSGR